MPVEFLPSGADDCKRMFLDMTQTCEGRKQFEYLCTSSGRKHRPFLREIGVYDLPSSGGSVRRRPRAWHSGPSLSRVVFGGDRSWRRRAAREAGIRRRMLDEDAENPGSENLPRDHLSGSGVDAPYIADHASSLLPGFDAVTRASTAASMFSSLLDDQLFGSAVRQAHNTSLGAGDSAAQGDEQRQHEPTLPWLNLSLRPSLQDGEDQNPSSSSGNPFDPFDFALGPFTTFPSQSSRDHLFGELAQEYERATESMRMPSSANVGDSSTSDAGIGSLAAEMRRTAERVSSMVDASSFLMRGQDGNRHGSSSA